MFGLNSSGLEWDSLAGCCEYGNEPSGSMKSVEFVSDEGPLYEVIYFEVSAKTRFA
jgi:hypothetical protein